MAQRKITGTITDDTGQALPGATVTVSGTTQGTVSSLDGTYSLDVPSENAVLVFSFVGFTTKQVEVGSRSVIDIQLNPDVSALNEVVVIGYGTRDKRDITTSVSSIKAEEIKQTSSLNPEMAMQGKMSGVQVSGYNGNPFNRPTIRVRGTNTWRNADPLYVIDGIPVREAGGGSESLDNARFKDVRGPLNIMTMIDPNDIASMTVLKDASAAAIYGVAAANGVILITTKTGRKNQPLQVNVSAKVGIKNQNKRYDMLNTQQYTELQQRIAASDTSIAIPGPSVGLFNPDSSNYLGNSKTYNWQDAVSNDAAKFENYSVVISGGSSDVDYKVAMNYATDDGVTIGNYLDRLSGSAAVNMDITKWMRAGVNGRMSSVKGRDSQFNQSANIRNAAITPPWQPIYDPNGPLGFAPVLEGYDENGDWQAVRLYGEGTRNNPIAYQDLAEELYKSSRSMGNAYLTIEPIKGLTFTGKVFADRVMGERTTWQDYRANYFSVVGEDPTTRGGGTSLGSYAILNTMTTNFMKEFSVNYQKSFGKHNIDILANVLEQTWEGSYQTATSEYMVSTNPDLRNIPTNSDNQYTNLQSETIVRDALIGQFVRAGYNFDNTYYIDATVRRDGSTRFAPENRFGIFPSASVAYRISNASFMQATKSVVNDLKLRAGWGQLGNYDVATLQYLSAVEEKPSFAFGDTGDGVGTPYGGSAVFSLANRNLSWERTTTLNVGFDALIFKNLDLSFDYYKKTTSDLLQTIELPLSVGVSQQPFANVGSVENTGIEISLGYDFKVGDFNFNVGGNLTTNQNKVKTLYSGIPQYGGNVLEEGQPINFIRGYKVEGMFQTQKEVDDYLAKYGDANYTSEKVAQGIFIFKIMAVPPETVMYSDLIRSIA